jgi:hypothetical protein
MRDFLEWGVGPLVGDHHVGCCGFGGRVFDTRACFLPGLASSLLSGSCRFGLGLLRPGRLPIGGHFRLLRRFQCWLMRGVWICGWSGCGLDETPLRTTRSYLSPRSICFAEIPALDHSERRSGLSRRSYGTLIRSLWKDRIRFFLCIQTRYFAM